MLPARRSSPTRFFWRGAASTELEQVPLELEPAVVAPASAAAVLSIVVYAASASASSPPDAAGPRRRIRPAGRRQQVLVADQVAHLSRSVVDLPEFEQPRRPRRRRR